MHTTEYKNKKYQIPRPQIQCPKKCEGNQEMIEKDLNGNIIVNGDGAVKYKDGFNSFNYNITLSNGNQCWICSSCEVTFTTDKYNVNQITERSKKHLSGEIVKESYKGPRPQIQCLKECKGNQEKIKKDLNGNIIVNGDGTVKYIEGLNSFIYHRALSNGNQQWRCNSCKVTFATDKYNVNQITEQSKKHLSGEIERKRKCDDNDGQSLTKHQKTDLQNIRLNGVIENLWKHLQTGLVPNSKLELSRNSNNFLIENLLFRKSH